MLTNRTPPRAKPTVWIVIAAVAFALTPGVAIPLASPAATPATASVVTVKVPLPRSAAKPGGPLVLHVEDLKLPPGSSGHVRVYANLPDADALAATAATEPSPDDPHYLGSITVPAKNSAEAAKGIERKSATLDISDKAPRLAGKGEASLTFVALRAPTAAASPEAADQKPKIGRAYFDTK
jgi:hypothetical protein